MGAHRLDHGLGRHRSGGAEIGRAEDRHLGDDAGMLDQIADAHDVAGDGGFGFEPRPFLIGRGGGGGAEREQGGGGDDECADHGFCLSASGWRLLAASGRRR